jgi:hypothetical protein
MRELLAVAEMPYARAFPGKVKPVVQVFAPSGNTLMSSYQDFAPLSQRGAPGKLVPPTTTSALPETPAKGPPRPFGSGNGVNSLHWSNEGGFVVFAVIAEAMPEIKVMSIKHFEFINKAFCYTVLFAIEGVNLV